jgi:hypothetical protein
VPWIVTPVSAHHDLARQALENGKHIFVGSKPRWFTISDDLPQYEEHADYRARVKEVIRSANRFELLVILAADTANQLSPDALPHFWAKCAAEFKTNPNVFFAPSPGVNFPGIQALVVVTYRSDEVDPGHPFAVLLGDLAGRPTVHTHDVPGLSVEAVRALAAEAGADLDAAALHRYTGGNAFHVTEVLASGGEAVPTSVRDAVRARVSRLDPDTRAALEMVALAGREHRDDEVLARSVDRLRRDVHPRQ